MKRVVTILLLILLFSYSNVYAQSLSDKVVSLFNSGDNSLVDDYPDNNVRFIGQNPNNFVKFESKSENVDDNLWRIIGVFDGKIKMMKYLEIGNYAYSEGDVNINDVRGINEWSISVLKDELNSDYLNDTLTSNTTWFQKVKTDRDEFDNKVYTFLDREYNYKYSLLSKYSSMIDESTWYLGSPLNNNGSYLSSSHYDVLKPNYLYECERSDLLGKACNQASKCNDTVERTATWNGKAGLMYASDYYYSSDGGTLGRDVCISVDVNKWSSDTDTSKLTGDDYQECRTNSWITNGTNIWTMTPYASSDAGSVALIHSDGRLYKAATTISYSVHPTVFLKSNIELEGGTGTHDDPYTIKEVEEVVTLSDTSTIENNNNEVVGEVKGGSETKNPETLDNIYNYVLLLITSIISVLIINKIKDYITL